MPPMLVKTHLATTLGWSYSKSRLATNSFATQERRVSQAVANWISRSVRAETADPVNRIKYMSKGQCFAKGPRRQISPTWRVLLTRKAFNDS